MESGGVFGWEEEGEELTGFEVDEFEAVVSGGVIGAGPFRGAPDGEAAVWGDVGLPDGGAVFVGAEDIALAGAGGDAPDADFAAGEAPCDAVAGA